MQSDNLDIFLCNPPYGLSSRWRTTVKMAFQESSSSEERRTQQVLYTGKTIAWLLDILARNRSARI